MWPKIFLAFVLLASSLLSVRPCHAQWGFYTSNRNAYVPFRGDQRGIFFPEKDPEEPEISAGPVVFRPGLGVSETWTSNPTFAPVDTEDDFITRLFPALRVELPYKRDLFEAEYMGDFGWFSRNPRFDADNHYFTARARVKALEDSWLFFQSVTALLYTSVEDIRLYIPELDHRRRFNYYSNTVSFNPPTYKKLSLMVQYSSALSRYQNEADQEGDNTYNNPSLSLGYLVWPRTRLVLGYGFIDYASQQRYPSSDYREHKLFFGVDWSVADRLNMNLEASYNWDEFTDISDSVQLWGAKMKVRYRPLERLSLEAGYERSSQPTLTFTGERFDPLTDTYSIYYVQDIADLSCEYQFRRNLTLWLNFMYKRFDYPADARAGTARLDSIYGGTAQIVYAFRPWLRLSVAGGYSRDDSSEVYEDYENIASQAYVQCAF